MNSDLLLGIYVLIVLAIFTYIAVHDYRNHRRRLARIFLKGESLDRVGTQYGLPRFKHERDGAYRARLIAFLRAPHH